MLRNLWDIIDPRGAFEPISAADIVAVIFTVLLVGFYFYAMSRPIP